MKSLLKELTKGQVTFESIEYQRRYVLISLLTIVGLTALFIFGGYLFYKKLYTIAVLDFSVFFTVLGLHLYAKKKDDYRISIRLELILIGILFLYMLIASPVNIGGWGWATLYPLIVMFTLGKEGIAYGVIFLLGVIGGLVLRSTPLIEIETYRPTLISRILFMYVVTFSLAIVIEKVWRDSLQVLNGLHEELKGVTLKLAKAKKEVEELSLHDPLTGLYNRRYFDAILHDISLISAREFSSLGIMMVDIDHFKKINDTYGHAIGDHALVAVTQAISKVIRRKSDLLFRYGGEEFIVLLYGPSKEQMHILANDIRMEVTRPYLIDQIERVSVSMGGALWKPEALESIEDFVQFADSAMYSSKENGRDRYTFYNKSSLSKPV